MLAIALIGAIDLTAEGRDHHGHLAMFADAGETFRPFPTRLATEDWGVDWLPHLPRHNCGGCSGNRRTFLMQTVETAICKLVRTPGILVG